MAHQRVERSSHKEGRNVSADADEWRMGCRDREGRGADVKEGDLESGSPLTVAVHVLKWILVVIN